MILITTFLGVGWLRPAPGTWGSLAAIPFAWALHGLFGPVGLVLATLAVAAVGHYAIQVTTAGQPDPDSSHIVIDEVVGQWIALWPVSIGLALAGASPWNFPWPGWVVAFLAFRLFDIWKPGPVRYFDRRKDALGVIMDDVVAGVLAVIVVCGLAALFHLVIA